MAQRDDGFDLLHFVALSGEAGRRLLTELERVEYLDVARENGRCLQALRQGQREQGRHLLVQLDRRLRALDVSPTVRNILRGCWYHAAVAYGHYCDDQLDGAACELERADESLRLALVTEPCLLPLVERLLDFQLQRARIAHRGRHWREALAHVDLLRAMITGRAPVLMHNNEPVYLSALHPYYGALNLGPAEQLFVQQRLLDMPKRLRQLEASAWMIFSSHNFVIPYR